MGFIGHILFLVALNVSRLLDPLMIVVNRIDAYLASELEAIRVPPDWRTLGIGVLWTVGLYSLFRVLPWWLGVVLIVLTALVVAKVNALLPATGGVRLS